MTFYGLTHPLNKSWHVLGLGYSPSIDRSEIENAAVIHYNGNMKPWLELAMTKYRSYWAKYIKFDHPYIHSCKLGEWMSDEFKSAVWSALHSHISMTVLTEELHIQLCSCLRFETTPLILYSSPDSLVFVFRFWCLLPFSPATNPFAWRCMIRVKESL